MGGNRLRVSKRSRRTGAFVLMALMLLTAFYTFSVINVRAVDSDGDGISDDKDLDPINNLKITVTIKEALQIDPVDVGSVADFYWKVTVAGVTVKSAEPWAKDQGHIYPNWANTWDVSDDKTKDIVHITIALYDDDGISDDTMDISGSTSKCEIDYDLKSGWWTGTDCRLHVDQTPSDDANGYGHTSGNEDGSWTSDKDDCEVWFSISQTDYDNDGIPYYQETVEFYTDPKKWDTDGDGLCDWEARYRWTFDPNAWNDPNGNYDGDEFTNSQEINTYKTNPTRSDRWAVICVGGTHDGAQDEFERTGNLAHQTLTNLGYFDDHMWYMTSDAGMAGRDQDHGKEFAWLSIVSFLHSFSDRDDRLFIYFVDHGEQNTGHFAIGSDRISDTELGQWVGSIATNAPGWSRLVCVIECCYSGNHVDDLQGARRIAISSSSSTQPSWAWDGGLTIFGGRFFQRLAAGDTVDGGSEANPTGAFWNAHNYANQQTDPDQDPQMNDQIAGDYRP